MSGPWVTDGYFSPLLGSLNIIMLTLLIPCHSFMFICRVRYVLWWFWIYIWKLLKGFPWNDNSKPILSQKRSNWEDAALPNVTF